MYKSVLGKINKLQKKSFGSSAKVVSGKTIFRNRPSETRIACGGHAC
jgi:hypothetical protein